MGAGLSGNSRAKPVLFVTNHAPPDRVGAFAALHEREDVLYALFGGRITHGVGLAGLPAGKDDLPFPHRRLQQREVYALASSGAYRAVVCGTVGRTALPAAWAGACRARVPLLLWSALWAQPRSLAHVASALALRRLYASADAVVAYGPHVERYVRARGARNVHVAPQAVDNAFWSAPAGPAPAEAWPSNTAVRFLFVGRQAREKGLWELLEAWRASGLRDPLAALVLVGPEPGSRRTGADGAEAQSESRTGSDRANFRPPAAAAGAAAVPVTRFGPVDALQLRNFYAAAHVVVMPSIATPTFREPWGLVANEAMNQSTAVIATDAVGAAAGGLIRDGRNGLVVRAGDVDALAGALTTMARDGELRARAGLAAREDVAPYTQQAWARGFSAALRSVGASRAEAV